MPTSGPLLCRRCRRLISADETVCPHCGTRHPASPWRRWLGSLLGLDPDTLTNAVIYLNVAMFALSLVLAPRRIGLSANPLSFLSPSDSSLLLLGATGTVPIDRLHRWWSLLAANYLHGGILHIFFNMAALRQLGPVVVREYGVHRATALYTLGGVAGFAVSYLAGIPLTIGASAAVCSLIGGLLYYGKNRGGAYGNMVFQRVWGWAVGLFVFGLLVPGINNWGHGGGMAAGFLLGSALGYQEKVRESSGHRWLGSACAAATILVLAWAVLSSVVLRFSS